MYIVMVLIIFKTNLPVGTPELFLYFKHQIRTIL